VREAHRELQRVSYGDRDRQHEDRGVENVDELSHLLALRMVNEVLAAPP
jgi:hypothetical protein